MDAVLPKVKTLFVSRNIYRAGRLKTPTCMVGNGPVFISKTSGSRKTLPDRRKEDGAPGKMDVPATTPRFAPATGSHTDSRSGPPARAPSSRKPSPIRAAAMARRPMDRGFPPGRAACPGPAGTRPAIPAPGTRGDPVPANRPENHRGLLPVHPPAGE